MGRRLESSKKYRRPQLTRLLNRRTDSGRQRVLDGHSRDMQLRICSLCSTASKDLLSQSLGLECLWCGSLTLSQRAPSLTSFTNLLVWMDDIRYRHTLLDFGERRKRNSHLDRRSRTLLVLLRTRTLLTPITLTLSVIMANLSPFRQSAPRLGRAILLSLVPQLSVTRERTILSIPAMALHKVEIAWPLLTILG